MGSLAVRGLGSLLDGKEFHRGGTSMESQHSSTEMKRTERCMEGPPACEPWRGQAGWGQCQPVARHAIGFGSITWLPRPLLLCQWQSNVLRRNEMMHGVRPQPPFREWNAGRLREVFLAAMYPCPHERKLGSPARGKVWPVSSPRSSHALQPPRWVRWKGPCIRGRSLPLRSWKHDVQLSGSLMYRSCMLKGQ